MTRPPPDPLEVLRQATGGPGRRAELWPRLALVLLVLTALAYAYLGSRPGGPGPVWVFTQGRDWLSLTALVVLSFAIVQSLLRRPFLQRGRARGLVALVLVIGIAPFPFPYPSSHADSPSAVPFRLPVAGEWRVLWGGQSGHENRPALVAPDRSSALHLVLDADLALLMGGERASEPAGWSAFGRRILAPADGRVVALRDGLSDRDLAAPAAELEGPDAFGNRIALEVAPGEFLHLTHLRSGSIAVALGAEVRAGELLARVGSSGLSRLSPLPHVALHLSDSSVVGRGEGIPWSLVAYESDGRAVERGAPSGGFADDGSASGDRVRDPTR